MTTRRLGTAPLIATILVPAAAVLAVLLLARSGAIRVISPGPLDGQRSRAWLEFSGFYASELDGQRPFSWMGPTGRFRLPRLDRSAASRLSLWVQPAAIDRPVDLTATVDGLPLAPRRLVPGPQRIDIDLPARSMPPRAVITLAVSETIVPGPADPRTLGLRVDAIALEPVGGPLRIPTVSLRAALIAGLAIGIVLAVTLPAGPLTWALGAATGSWFGFLLVYDGAFLGLYPARLQAVALGAAAVAPLCRLFTRPTAEEPWSWRTAASVVLVITVCKLALFVHPMVTVGDSIFHVHRAQMVLAGQYFFTSITPRPYYEFPYAPGLYVAVAPLWDMFRLEMEHVWLLRAATLAAEGGLALAVYGVVAAHWGDRLTAWLASTISLLIPAGIYTICTSNLTNSFGQSVFGIGLAALLCAHLRRGWILACLGTVLLCAGFLSHFSTFSVGVPLAFACTLAVFAGGAGATRRTAIALALALVVSATASVAVYYAHFMPVYRKTAERILAREGEGTTRSMVAPASQKATRVTTTIWHEFGAVILLGAVAAGGLRLRARARDPLTLALAGWAAVVLGFWLLAIVTAVEMRASLAAIPLAAILVAGPLAMAARDGRWARVACAAALGSIVLHALSDWTMCLGLEHFWRI